MKKKIILTSVATVACIGLVGAYTLSQHSKSQGGERDNQVAYVTDSKKTTKDDQHAKREKLTPEEVSKKEGIAAEQIVIKITDDGYVTLHGDHYHFYNGKVPFDAIISEDLLMKDPNYTLKQEDVVNEVKDGYIIKVNGQYYLYLRDPQKRSNVRSSATVAQQQQAAANNRGSDGHYRTDDGYVFNASDIVDDTGDAYIVTHNGHYHYIPKSALPPQDLQAGQAYWNSLTAGQRKKKSQPLRQVPPAPHTPKVQGKGDTPAEETLDQLFKQLYALPKSQRYHEGDGYVFDPKDIRKITDYGVVVPHGNHEHFIPFAKLSPLEIKISKLWMAAKQKKATPKKPSTPKTPSPTPKDDQPSPALQQLIDQRVAQIMAQYQIPRDQIIVDWKNNMIVYPHGDHYHTEPIDTGKPIGDPKQQDDEEVKVKKAYLAAQLGIDVSSIQVVDTPNGKALVYPHGDHQHSILLKDIDTSKPFDPHGHHGDPHAHQQTGMDTLKKLGFDDDIIRDILHAVADEEFPANETDPEKMKAWLLTVKKLNIGQNPDPLTRKGLDLMPNIEVLGIGFTPIKDPTPVLKFKKLKQLWMTQTGISNYDFLKGLPELEGIDISQNNVSDLSFLKEFPKLKSVAAAGNNISDISALKDLPLLESLNLEQNNISDISALKDLQHLTAISLEQNQLQDVSALANKPQLITLFLSSNPNLNVDTLRTESVHELYLNGNNIKNLSFLKHNVALTNLQMDNNQLTSLAGLEALPQIDTFSANQNQISSLAISGTQGTLQTLKLSENRLKNLEGINAFTSLQTLEVPSNQLVTLAITEQNHSLTYIDVRYNFIPPRELEFNENGIPKVLAQYYPSIRGGELGGQKAPQVKAKPKKPKKPTTSTEAKTTSHATTEVKEPITSVTNDETTSRSTTIGEPTTSRQSMSTVPTTTEVPTTTTETSLIPTNPSVQTEAITTK
ncbi:pneumococcal-type histidine triad protein [Streptococcus ovis]|uniref:pneumococcal-type histidine triad protein n=1 Tax=Streptococcus ovis TaxID=82806 RepID=UPI00036F33D2|nr:pneumococcal-type histidine triad protein [Streptococcus ovis]